MVKLLALLLVIGVVVCTIIERREDGDIVSGVACPRTRPIAGCAMEVGLVQCCEVICMAVEDFHARKLDYMHLPGGDFALKRRHHIYEYIIFNGCKWVSIFDQLVYQGKYVLFAYKRGALYAVFGTKRRYGHLFHANGVYQPPTPITPTKVSTSVRTPTTSTSTKGVVTTTSPSSATSELLPTTSKRTTKSDVSTGKHKTPVLVIITCTVLAIGFIYFCLFCVRRRRRNIFYRVPDGALEMSVL